MKKRYVKIASLLLALALLLCSCGKEQRREEATQPLAPVVDITIWNYYSGDLLESFNVLVDEFNRTYGAEQRICVTSYSCSDVNELAGMVLDGLNDVPHAEEPPNIFSAYADTAYDVDQMGELVDLSQYLTEEELSAYVEGYVDEGRFGEGVKIFPVAKSMEVMVLNQTDWEKFSSECSVTLDELSTMEGITAVAETYYNWTDAQTGQAGDGKAFFGRDAMANYMIIGAMQLGVEIFDVKNGQVLLNFDRDVMRKLWDNYYVPMVKGWFAAESRFRNDDMKTGDLICYIGSSSGVSYIPNSVAAGDDEVYPIDTIILPCPKFSGGAEYATQQGAGMVVLKSTEEEERACVEFLKWFTQAQRNIEFAVASGYLPVTEEGNSILADGSAELNIPELHQEMLAVAADTALNNKPYTYHAFPNANTARSVLEYSMSDLAAADRAVVEERLAQGESLEVAAAEFLTEEYFDLWYEATLKELALLCA